MKEIEFVQVKKTFSMKCTVKANIHANPEVIWALLTDAKGFPRWNFTVTGIDGNIREGERIRIHVPGTDRTFRPRISNVVKNKSMVWSNGFAPIFKGVRTFGLRKSEDGSTEFTMEEKFSGLMFALMKNRFPDFRLIFQKYASDLKKEAERITERVPIGVVH